MGFDLLKTLVNLRNKIFDNIFLVLVNFLTFHELRFKLINNVNKSLILFMKILYIVFLILYLNLIFIIKIYCFRNFIISLYLR